MMKILTRLCVATLALLAVPALAQPGWRGERRHRFAESAAAAERQAVPEGPAQAAEFRRYDSRHGRLSPEERRQLRRDIQDAGVGLYRRPPLPPPPPPLAPPP